MNQPPPLAARLCVLLPLGLALACGSDGGDTSTTGLPAPDEGTFSVLSYNVHGLPDLLTNTPRPGVERRGVYFRFFRPAQQYVRCVSSHGRHQPHEQTAR